MTICARYRPLLAGILCLLLTAGCEQHDPERGPMATDPWIRLAPPGAGMLAGYLVLENPGDRSLELTSVSSPAFASAEIHRTEIIDGVARMIAEPRISIPAGERLVFEPGGRHLMLHGPVSALAEGQQVPLELAFSDGTILSLKATVRRSHDAGSDHDAHQHH